MAYERAAPRETDALLVRVRADALMAGHRTMPAGRPRAIPPERLADVRARWAAGDRAGTARALLGVWVYAYRFATSEDAEGIDRLETLRGLAALLHRGPAAPSRVANGAAS